MKLVAAPLQLRNDCSAAAGRLGFAVPCPSQVPAVSGHGESCPAPQGVEPAACVGLEGLPAHPIFDFELTGFDVPPTYRGVDGKAMGHLVIEARPHRESPTEPCIGAKRIGGVLLGRWAAAEYTCPGDSVKVQREAMHGEGVYAGHLLLEWNQDGVDYIASAHGHTSTNVVFLERLVRSMTLLPPARS